MPWAIERRSRRTSYDDRVLGHQSGDFQKRMQEGRLLEAGALNRIILYVTALMEVKSSMGVIVAMPTAGACAALPGAVIAMAEARGQDEEAMARAILASGLVGVFIATAWTFAAEVGGCQAEGGSAAGADEVEGEQGFAAEGSFAELLVLGGAGGHVAERDALLGNVFLFSGAAVLVASTLVFVIDPGNVDRPEAARVTISPRSIDLVVRW